MIAADEFDSGSCPRLPYPESYIIEVGKVIIHDMKHNNLNCFL